MAERSQLEFDILVAKDALTAALNSAKTAATGVEGGLTKVGSGFGSINSVAEGLVGTIGKVVAAAAALGIAFSFHEAIEAAEKQEHALHSLNLALAQNNQFSAEASQSFQDFASGLQRTTRFADEAVLSSAALFGSLTKLNNDGIKKATAASADLAATLGIDLDSATSLVTKAIEGNTAGLSRYGLQVRKGANETENYANVLAALAPFQGRAEAQANTFEGAMAKLKNQFGEVLESIGNYIIKNPIFISAINEAANAFAFLAKFLADSQDSVIAFTNALIKGFGQALISVNSSVNFIIQVLVTMLGVIRLVLQGFNELFKLFDNSQGNLNLVTEGLSKLVTALLEVPKGLLLLIQTLVELSQNIPSIGSALKRAGIDVDGLDENIQNAIDGIDKLQVKIAGVNIGDVTIKGLDAIDSVIGKTQDVLKGQKDISANFGKQITEFSAAHKELKEQAITNIQQTQFTARSALEQVYDLFTKQGELAHKLNDIFNNIDKTTGLTKFQTALDGFFVSSGAALTKGAEGAKQLIVSGVTSFGNLLVKGLGDFAGPIIGLFAQGPEAVKKTIKEFIGAIPTIIENIILSLPAVFEAIIEAIPDLLDHILSYILSGKFIGKVLEAIVRVIVGIPKLIVNTLITLMKSIPKILVDLFITELPRIINELINAIPTIIIEFVKGAGQFVSAIISGAFQFVSAIVSGAANFVGTILSGAAGFVGEIISGAGRFVSELIGSIPGVGSILGGGGGGGGIPFIGDFFDFNKGGGIPGIYAQTGLKVPLLSPKGTDTFPIMTSPGEYIIDRGTTNKLNDFLDGQQSNRKSEGLLEQILTAVKTPQRVESEITINKRVFADLILELNRSNARLA